jgi:ABC-type multidrug transport system fused ATPase/permease subunit
MDIKNKKIGLRGFWGRLWELLKPFRREIIWSGFFISLLEVTRLAGPYILKIIIDLLTNFSRENIDLIFLLAFGLFAANQLVGVLDYFLDKRLIKITGKIEEYLPVNALKKMLSLSLGYHEKENTGNKIVKIERGVDKIDSLLSNIFWEVGPTIAQTIFTAIALLLIDYRFCLIFIIFAPIFAYLSFKGNQRITPLRIERYNSYEESSGLMTQAVININTVQSFVQEERERNNFAKLRNSIFSNLIKEFDTLLKFGFWRNFLVDFGRILIMLFGLYLVLKGSLTIGSLVFVITISEKALISFFRISRLYDRIMESSEAIDRLYFLDQEESRIKNPDNGVKPKTIRGQIEFKNLSFKYGDKNKIVLDKINFQINSGCVTALVGPSGGGKTTVVKLLYRHYDPSAGRILIDGVDLKKYDLPSLRRFIAIVPQDVEVFNMSVKENIAYARAGASKEEIRAAARIANAEEFILNLPKDYDSLVGERGIRLSGGQRQRIGIARAVLANPRILIFDEATSNLDSYSERLIQDAIDKISKGRTMIIIAHRLSTIRKADKIVVLENGKVVEEGSHYELAKTDGGLYSKLLNLQQMGDVE